MGNSTSSNATSSLPNDNRINQLFFLNKCTDPDGNDKKFYEWCSSLGDDLPPTTTAPDGNENVTDATENDDVTRSSYADTDTYWTEFKAKCSNIYGARGECTYTLNFKGESELHERELCDLGNKFTDVTYEREVPPGVFKEIKDHCYYWLVGKPFPWWAILLIVLSIVIAFSIAGFLAWRYWLQKRWQRQRGSTLESRWTESPVSSASAIQPVPRPAPLQLSRPNSYTTSQHYNMNSGGMASRGGYSMGSRAPSLRSGLSRSGGRRSGKGSRSSSRKGQARSGSMRSPF